jgi:hypothetical protein
MLSSRNLQTELDAFFRSSATNAERLPLALKQELAVETALDGIVARALKRGQSVVIAR